MAIGTRLCLSLAPAALSLVVSTAHASAARGHVSPDGAVYTFGSGPSGEAMLTIDSGELHVEKSVASDGRSVLTLRAAGDQVRLDVTDARVLVSSQDGDASIVPNGSDAKGEQAVRVAVARSRAVQLFRSFAAQVSGRARKTAFDEAVALSGALLGQLAGDPGALRVFAGRHRQGEGRVRQIGARLITDCWGQYEQYISWAWDQYVYCLADAGRKIFIGPLTWCEVRYTMQAESAWFQFLSCSTIPVV